MCETKMQSYKLGCRVQDGYVYKQYFRIKAEKYELII